MMNMEPEQMQVPTFGGYIKPVQSQNGKLRNKFINNNVNNKRKYIGVAGHPNAYENLDPALNGFDNYSYRSDLVVKGGQFST
jgi:hypothetical protein